MFKLFSIVQNHIFLLTSLFIEWILFRCLMWSFWKRRTIIISLSLDFQVITVLNDIESFRVDLSFDNMCAGLIMTTFRSLISEEFSYGYEVLFVILFCWFMGFWPVVASAWKKRDSGHGLYFWHHKPMKSKAGSIATKRHHQTTKVITHSQSQISMNGESGIRDGARRVSVVNGRNDRPKISECRQEILLCLERRQITRAVNMLRWIERNKLEDQLRDETFFMAFLQASCRVGMVDVADRLFHLMAQNGAGHCMSAEFWHHIFKIMSSRRVQISYLNFELIIDQWQHCS